MKTFVRLTAFVLIWLALVSYGHAWLALDALSALPKSSDPQVYRVLVAIESELAAICGTISLVGGMLALTTLDSALQRR